MKTMKAMKEASMKEATVKSVKGTARAGAARDERPTASIPAPHGWHLDEVR